MSRRKISYVDASKALTENRNRREQTRLAATQKAIDEREQMRSVIENARDLRIKKERNHAMLMESARDDNLGTALKAIYITALDPNSLTETNLAYADGMVDNYINERGGATSVLNNVKNHTYFLSRLTQIIEDASKLDVHKIENMDRDLAKEAEVTDTDPKEQIKNDVHNYHKEVQSDNGGGSKEGSKHEPFDKTPYKDFKPDGEDGNFKTQNESAPDVTSSEIDIKEAFDLDSMLFNESLLLEDDEESDDKKKDSANVTININNDDKNKKDDDKEDESSDDKEEAPEEESEEIEVDTDDNGDTEIVDDTEESSDDEGESEDTETPEDKDEEEAGESEPEEDAEGEEEPEAGEDEDETAEEDSEDEGEEEESDPDLEKEVDETEPENDDDLEDLDNDGENDDQDDVDVEEVENDDDEDGDGEDDDVEEIVGDDLDGSDQDSDDSIDGNDDHGKLFQDLEDEPDVKKAIEIIRDRIADAEETFIKNNAKDKEQITKLVDKISNNVKTVNDAGEDSKEGKIAQESAACLNRYRKDIQQGRPVMSIFEKIVRKLNGSMLKNRQVLESYIDEDTGKLDEGLIIEAARVLYGWVETVNTLQLEKVDEAFIDDIISSIQ